MPPTTTEADLRGQIKKSFGNMYIPEYQNTKQNTNIFPLVITQHCLPDCEETHYTSSLSSAPFRRCDYKNLGMTPLCQLGDPEYLGSSVGSISPPMWGGSVIDQYRKGT